MITSKPGNSTLYGAIMGSLLFGMFKKDPAVKQEPKKKKEEMQIDWEK